MDVGAIPGRGLGEEAIELGGEADKGSEADEGGEEGKGDNEEGDSEAGGDSEDDSTRGEKL
jgi:hypothetical protein